MEHVVPKPKMSIEGLVIDYNLKPDGMTERITPADDLFVLAHVGVPEISLADWSLEICGIVAKPMTLKFDDLSRFPKRTVETIHTCAGNPFDPTVPTRQIANVRWSGVDLRDLMEAVGVSDDATYLWAYGPDHGEFGNTHHQHYLKDVPISRIRDGDVLIAYELNSAPLSAKHGYPARLVVPGFYGTNSVKWICRLEFSDRRADSFYTTTTYNDPDYDTDPSGTTKKPVWEIAPESLIVAPAPDWQSPVVPIEIWGWAWSNCEVQLVEVSTGATQSWLNASLEPATGRSWKRFSYLWTPPATGKFELCCRATDTKGESQPAQGWRNAVHSVTIRIE